MLRCDDAVSAMLDAAIDTHYADATPMLAEPLTLRRRRRRLRHLLPPCPLFIY